MRRGLVVLAGIAAGALAVSAAGRGAGTPALVFAADRAPSLTGEVYRLPLGGRPVDLSRSPFSDTSPAVSPDGSLVAFASTRRGDTSLYVVGARGGPPRRLAALSPRTHVSVQLAWSPDGRSLAATASDGIRGRFLVVGLDGKAHVLETGASVRDPGWSPDGRVATVANGVTVDAFAAGGTRAWTAVAGARPPGWSRAGLYATGAVSGRIRALDSRGRTVFSVAADVGAWSPEGARLAVARGRELRVVDTRGRTLFAKRVAAPAGEVSWLDRNHLVVRFLNGRRSGSVDLRTGRTASAGARMLDDRAFSATGALVATTVRTGARFAIRVNGRTVGRVPSCTDDGAVVAALTDLRFTPDGRALVYQSSCFELPADLWAVAPDGSGLRRLTATQAQETQPAWSPDGSQLVFSQAPATGLSCKGCPVGLRLAAAGGTDVRPLTGHRGSVFDVDASWSPDGKTILFVRQTPSSSDLYELPAAGGTATEVVANGEWAAWGPARIAWVSFGPAPTVWSANPDGSDPQRLATGDASHLAWSPDGRLAWLLPARDGRPRLAIWSAGTTTTVLLPFVEATGLAWSPDGTRLAVAARAAGTATTDVYTVASDGTGVRRLTHDLHVLDVDW